MILSRRVLGGSGYLRLRSGGGCSVLSQGPGLEVFERGAGGVNESVLPNLRGEPVPVELGAHRISTAIPRPGRSANRLTAIAATTMISAPGTLRASIRSPSTTTMTTTDTTHVNGCACGSARASEANFAIMFPPATCTPSMSGSSPTATCTPTPVRKPTSTVLERKLARNPTWTMRATISQLPASNATVPASAT
jgi:hypothetical protein